MAGVEKEFPGAGELVSADLFPQDRLPEVRWDLGVERTEHAGAPCGPETASGTNSSYKARPPGPLWRGLRALVWEIGQGLEGAGKSQRKKVLGGSQGRQRQLWLLEFSQPLSLLSLLCLFTHKAFLRNGGPQKAQFETSD